MKLEEKIQKLNYYAQAWYSTSQADALHEAIFRGQGFGKFADRCKEEAEEELEEAKKCTARVVALGGKPEYGFIEQPIFNDPKELLEYWAKVNPAGVKDLNELADSCDGDVVTRGLFEEFAADEEEHAAWVCKHLVLIEKLGYENYLLEMLDI